MSNGSQGIAAKLARPNILELLPYRCARDDYSEGILLDANENAWGSPMGKSTADVLERYPDPYQIPLKQRMAAFRGNELKPENMFVGVGSDEAIDLLFRIFCAPGKDKVITTPPTYGMYKVCAKVNDVEIVNVPLTPDFDLRVPEIIQAVTPEIKMIFLCSPGNPTSKTLPLTDIEAVATQAPNVLVIVDEAYVDFSDSSAVSLLSRYSNVCVLQTLSKAFGMAAIRCGFCFGAPDVIQLLNNVKAPYNINQLTSKVALEALSPDHLKKLEFNIQEVLVERAVVAAALGKLDFVVKVYPSDSNFILFRLKESAKAVYQKMADECGVVTRYRGSEMHCDECIRVTIGTPDENKSFLEALQKTYQKVTQRQ